ncbi:unnamed protein product [Ectocarpus sp. 4 AP-2014]
MDEEEKALAKKLRMARMQAELANIEAQKTVVQKDIEKVVKSDCGEKKGVRDVMFASRSSAFSKVNRLVLEASKETRRAFGKKATMNRSTLQYSLKNHQKTLRVAFHEHVRTFLYSQNPKEKDFLDGFYLEFKEKSLATKPGSKAENYRKEKQIGWAHHDWKSGEIRTVPVEEKAIRTVPVEEKAGGGKKRKKSCDEGAGES